MKKKYLFTIIALSACLTAGCGQSGGGAVADIGRDRAADIALSDAGVSESDVSRLSISLDRDDTVLSYDIEFTEGNTRYDYEVQASDGTILRSEKDVSGGAEPTPQEIPSSTPAPTATPVPTATPQPSAPASGGQTGSDDRTSGDSVISFDEAKQLALDRVPGASDQHISMELDHEDGYLIYEGEIHYQSMEYEFEIDARNGNFLKWSADYHD